VFDPGFAALAILGISPLLSSPPNCWLDCGLPGTNSVKRGKDLLMSDDLALVATKFQPPVLKKGLLQRDHLLQQLRDNLDKRLVLLTAGAGYGKTVLLASLSRLLDCPWVWLNLDRFDRDWAVFLRYLHGAIRKNLPRAKVTDLVIPNSPDWIHIPLSRLISELETVDQRVVLILDDFHQVNGSKHVEGIVNFLLQRAPRWLCFILSGRWCPQLVYIPRLRVQNEIFQLGQESFRFSPAETYRLFREGYSLEITPREAAELTRLTEGWVSSLSLARQSYRWLGKGDAQTRPAARRQEIFEFLAYDVLFHERPAIQRFLHKTSILDLLSPALCDAVLGTDDSASLLEELVRRNLFTDRLDGRASWYRYHQEFRECLQRQILQHVSESELRALHHRAGQWFEAQGREREAIAHYTQAGSHHDAAHVIERTGEALLETGQLEPLEQWLAGIPHELITRHPGLLMLQGHILQYQERFTEALKAHTLAQRQFAAQADDDGQAKAVSQIGLSYYNLGDYATAYRLMGQALVDMKSAPHPKVLFVYGLVSADVESITQGITFCHRALQLYEARGDLYQQTLTLYTLSSLYAHAGDLERAQNDIQRAKLLHKSLALDERLLCRILNVEGQVHWLQGDSERALSALSEAQVLAVRHQLAMLESWVTLAKGNVYRDQSDFGLAQACYDRALDLSEKANHPNTSAEVMNEVAWLALLTGRPKVARQWGERALALIGSEKTSYHPFIQVTLGVTAHVLGETTQARIFLRRAIEVLDRVDERIGALGAHLHMAYLHYETGDEREGDYHLAEGMRIAAAGQFRAFPFWHPRVVSILCATAIARHIQANYAAWLCARRLDAAATPHLLPLLSQGDTIAIERTINVLNVLGDGRAIAPLQRLAVLGTSEAVRLVAMAAIERIRERHPASEVPPFLRLYCLGELRVYRGNDLVTEAGWQRGRGATLKAKTLLVYLMLRGQPGVPRDELTELLWPGETDCAKVSNRLHNTLHALRRVLEPALASTGGESRYILYEPGSECYRLNPAVESWLDAEALEAHYRRGQSLEREGTTEAALAEYQAADTLYGGDFLTSLL